MGEVDLLGKLIPNAVSAVAVIVVVYMFLKAQKQYIVDMKNVSNDCHTATESQQKAFQDQVERISIQQTKLADGYYAAMQSFAAAIAANGATLIRMERALNRRGAGRRGEDWTEKAMEEKPNAKG